MTYQAKTILFFSWNSAEYCTKGISGQQVEVARHGDDVFMLQ